MRARVMAWAELLPALIIFLSRPFSAGTSRTPYFSCTIATSHPCVYPQGSIPFGIMY